MLVYQEYNNDTYALISRHRRDEIVMGIVYPVNKRYIEWLDSAKGFSKFVKTDRLATSCWDEENRTVFPDKTRFYELMLLNLLEYWDVKVTPI